MIHEEEQKKLVLKVEIRLRGRGTRTVGDETKYGIGKCRQ